MKVITTRSCALDMSDHFMDQFWRETFCEKLSVGNFLRKFFCGSLVGNIFGGSLVGNVPCTSGCCIVLRGEEKINEKEKKKESAQKGRKKKDEKETERGGREGRNNLQ